MRVFIDILHKMGRTLANVVYDFVIKKRKQKLALTKCFVNDLAEPSWRVFTHQRTECSRTINRNSMEQHVRDLQRI